MTVIDRLCKRHVSGKSPCG